MENYIVSARKYRPTTFASVVGQKTLTATLKNAIATDRLAHAYLFCGSRGVGKTSCARIFAKSINCENRTADGDPCNECPSCREFNENRSLNIIELDAASNNSVDDIRALVDQVQVPPTNGRYRVFIVDEVHMLSSAAFNAFLKTLEEPPSYVVFILATTEKQKIIPTILSRCQIYDFNRITVTDMVDHLSWVASNEGIEAERAALGVIARKADGAMRDALSIFDQVAASSRGHITYASTVDNLNVLDADYYRRLMEAFIAQDVTQALLIYKEVRDRGFDSHFFVTGLAAYLRDLMVAREPGTQSLLDTDADLKRQMSALAAKVPIEFFYKAMSLCNDADLHYRDASSKTFLVELLLIKLCQLLSPSPIFSGDGEGRLKPFAAPATPAAAVSETQPAASTSAAQPATPAGTHSGASSPAATTQAPSAAAAPASAAATPATPPAPPVSGSVPPAPAAPTPTASAPASPRPAAGKILRSTRPMAAAAAKTVQTDATRPAEKRKEEFTQTALQHAWDAYANAHETDRILANSMRSCRPETGDGLKYVVTLFNDIQFQKFDELKAELEAHLRDAVRNDAVTLEFIVKPEEHAELYRTDREIYHALLEDPKIRDFVKHFSLNPV